MYFYSPEYWLVDRPERCFVLEKCWSERRCLGFSPFWWCCRLLWYLGRMQLPNTANKKGFHVSPSCCDLIRMRKHTPRTHQRTLKVILFQIHLGTSYAPLPHHFFFNMLEFKGVQARWRPMLLFQLIVCPTICTDLVRSGFYELHKGMAIRASGCRLAVWPLSLTAGVLSALMCNTIKSFLRGRGSGWNLTKGHGPWCVR